MSVFLFIKIQQQKIEIERITSVSTYVRSRKWILILEIEFVF